MEPRKQLLPTIRPKSHSVNLLEYTNGRLMATWFAGSREGSEDQVAVASMLEPSKKEWSDPTIILSQFDYNGDRWVPEQTCPIETSEGTTMVYTWANPLSSFKLYDRGDGKVSGEASVTSISSAITYGKVWARDLPECRPFRFRLKNGRAVDIECISGMYGLPERGIVFQGQPVLRDVKLGPAGGWLIPYHTQREPLWMHSRFLPVEGDGITGIDNDVDLYEVPGCLEPALTQLLDGRWLCYMRYNLQDWPHGVSGGFIWRSESLDGGRTFSKPVLTNLRNPHSGIDVAVGKSGRLLILYNDSHQLRTPLTLGISEDEGITFSTRDIETGVGEFSYPKLHQTNDGIWRAMYTYQRDCIAEVCFEEEWLLDGRKVIGL
mgnify:FL=1